MFSISEIGFSKRVRNADDSLLRSYFAAYVFNCPVAENEPSVLFYLLKKMGIDTGSYDHASEMIQYRYMLTPEEYGKTGLVYNDYTNDCLTVHEKAPVRSDLYANTAVSFSRLHDIRVALCSEKRDFLLKLLEIQQQFIGSNSFRHDVYCLCNEYYADSHEIRRQLVWGIAVLKIYLNIPLDSDEKEFLYEISDSGFSTLFEPMTAAADPSFFREMHPELISILCSLAECKMRDHCNTRFYAVLTEHLSAEQLSDSFRFYRYGYDESLKTNIEITALELFFRGEFEKCIDLILDHQKQSKKIEKSYKLSDNLALLLNFSRLISEKDMDKANKECGIAARKCLKNDYLRMALAFGSLTHIFNLKTGRKKSWLVSMQELLYSKGSIPVGRILRSSAVFDLPSFVCFAAADHESIAKIDFADFIKKTFENTKTAFNSLAEKIYPTLRSAEGSDFSQVSQSGGYFDFTRFNENTTVWKNQLDSIKSILKLDSKSPSAAKRTKKSNKEIRRLSWVFTVSEDGSRINVRPFECFENPESGELRLDKDYSVSRFFSGSCLKQEHVTDQDRLIGATYLKGHTYGGAYYTFRGDKAIPLMKDHPYVFIRMIFTDSDHEYKSKLCHAKVESSAVDLHVTEVSDRLRLNMNLPEYRFDSLGCDVDFEKGLISFTQMGKVQLALADVIGEGIDFPKEAISDLSSLALSSDVKVEYDVKSENIKGDSRVALLLENTGRYYTARFRIKPLDEEKVPFKIPGRGEARMMISLGDTQRPVIVERNLSEEKENTRKTIEALPVLSNFDEDPENFEYTTDSIEYALDLLCEAKNDPAVSVHWGQGRRFAVSGSLSSKGIKLGSSVKDGLLALEGTVDLSLDRYISLRSLLDSVSETPGHYIRIDEENYVQISSDLKSRLLKLRSLTVNGKKKDELLAHPLSAHIFEDMFDGAQLSFTDEVKSILHKRDEAMALEVKVPKTLTADLRPYQIEGFSWLYRLSSWGVGACLADDMGLGKTIQTIALLLKLCRNGPSLIVCPTSLGANWAREIARFAPTLTVKRLRDSDNRDETVAGMKANEVLIVSYGLLVNEAGSLCSARWEAAVYDEAQSLKNSMTQRAKTAVKINARMSVALTGTPIENNLDDLWSIFNIINPGLLGSMLQFHSRFAGAASDKNAGRVLKLIISPFILRRLKNDVLDDLPARTEQVITVEPTVREAQLYETLRLKTIDELEKSRLSSDRAGQRKLKILAALTRLRQFCCDPGISSGELESAGISSKSEAFCDLLDEALSGGHRLLVFSQFVSYLTKIRELLEKKGISYQYLDGQTPEKKRAEAVDAFQSGDGDVFLISLKAGGQGLNLTGADYVVHLDPWWNPAVEDQATDRAYRIGQIRPVNVFRLVMKDSIEEKILELHAKKREVSATFLSGTQEVAEEAMKLSEEELLELLN